MRFDRVLVLAPHTDDGEIGAGGFIHKLIQQGSAVFYQAFSICEESVPDGFDRCILKDEIYSATSKLGIDSDWLNVSNYPVRRLHEYRQEILDDLVSWSRNIQPDLVLTPASTDIHQDHKTIYEESVRAFKFTNLLGYEIAWNHLEVKQQLHVVLSEENLQTKINAVNEYKSQLVKSEYSLTEFVKTLAMSRGFQVRQRYAECYEVIRMML